MEEGGVFVRSSDMEDLKRTLLALSIQVQEGDSEGAVILITQAYMRLLELDPTPEDMDYRKKMI